MEDVWKELSLSLTSLDHYYSTTGTAAPPPTGCLSLQEFLATPLNNIITSSNSEVLDKRQKKKPILANTRTTSDHRHKTPFCSPTSDAYKICASSKRKGGPSADGNATDLKKYKLMKNRESAARSRARKQAYISELEVELEHLIAENSKLRKEQEQLYAGAAAIGDQPQKKQRLQRTLTAPF